MTDRSFTTGTLNSANRADTLREPLMMLMAGRSSVPDSTAVEVCESIFSRRHCAPAAKPSGPAGNCHRSFAAEKSTVSRVDSAGRRVDKRRRLRTASLFCDWSKKL
ncbi:hypothetical protein D3C85_1279470 [compost metagenome]